MDQNTWIAIDPQLDEIAEELERILASSACDDLREMLTRFASSLPPDLSTDLSCCLKVCDSVREASLSLINVGLAVSSSGQVYPASGDSTVHRYVVDGEIEVVPNDICPKCYGEWGFKFENHNCRHCDAQLGVNCWALLDSDVCPFCEDGQITAQSPTCSNCGYVVDPKCVKWG